MFVSLPTGGSGKSLCYASLPLVHDELRGVQRKSIVVVVSPLKSLMQDQVSTFMARDLRASYLEGDGGSQVGSVAC